MNAVSCVEAHLQASASTSVRDSSSLSTRGLLMDDAPTMTDHESPESDLDLTITEGEFFLAAQGRSDLSLDSFEVWAESGEDALKRFGPHWVARVREAKARALNGSVENQDHFVPGVKNILGVLKEARSPRLGL